MFVRKEFDGYAHSYNVLRVHSIKINPLFLFYSLNSERVRQQMGFRFRGAAQHFLDIRAISRLLVPCPTLAEQEKIVSILSRVDEIIFIEKV